MEISNQCCLLNTALQLQHLGIDQNSEYYFYLESPSDKQYNLQNIVELENRNLQFMIATTDHISAFNSAELGQMLPYIFDYNGEKCFISSTKYESDPYKFICGIHTHSDTGKVIAKKYIRGTTDAEVKAQMLIYLIEKRFINISDCNGRLSQ